MYLKFNEFSVIAMQNMRGGKGTVYIRKSPYLLENMRMYAQITIPFGASIGYHEHSDDEEIITVLSGSGILKIEEKEYNLKVGDISLTKKGCYHSIENKNLDDLVLLAVINKL